MYVCSMYVCMYVCILMYVLCMYVNVCANNRISKNKDELTKKLKKDSACPGKLFSGLTVKWFNIAANFEIYLLVLSRALTAPLTATYNITNSFICCVRSAITAHPISIGQETEDRKHMYCI